MVAETGRMADDAAPLAEEAEGIELLGARLRSAREERSIGVRQLARMVDCSASLISQIERGRANPSVSTLYAIATALGISLDGLFADATLRAPEGRPAAPASAPPAAEEVHPLVLRARQRRVINLERGVQWQLLMPVPERNAEFLEAFYAPGGGSTTDDHAIRHNGREYSLVLEGTLSVEIGFEQYELAPGDSMAFDSTIPHRFWNAGAVPVRAIWFVMDRWATPDNSGSASLLRAVGVSDPQL